MFAPTHRMPAKTAVLEAARRLLPPDQGRTFAVSSITENGLTQDIVSAVVAQFRRSYRDTARIAPQLVGTSTADTLQRVWAFVRHQITYVLDAPPGTQWIKTPRTVIQSGFCDCKGLATLINSLLVNQGFDPYFKFVSYVPGGEPTHVYTFVEAEGKRYVLDACMPAFNVEKDYSEEQLVRALP